MDTVPERITTSDLVSLRTFYAILWTSTSVCTLLYASRLYIRYRCFGRLLAEDWVLGLAWVMLVCITAIGQAYLKAVYMLMAVSSREATPGANFIAESEDALRAFGIAIIFSYVGIWAIKLNFLLFFKRLGRQIAIYAAFWWLVLVVTMVCGVINIGLIQFHCLFDNLVASVACSQTSVLRKTYDIFKVSCITDVITDAFIIGFPIAILWKVRLNWKKKLMLGGIFSLVTLTIAVTIVRGSIFGGTYKLFDVNKEMEMNLTWIWFWFFIEFTVSFIIACLVSFRALFVQRKKNSKEKEERRIAPQNQNSKRRSWRQGFELHLTAQHFHDSVLRSFKHTEASNYLELPMPPSGNFSAAFISDIADSYSMRERVDSPSSSAA